MIKKRTAWRILFCLLFCLGVGFAAGITAFSDGQVQEQPASTLFSTKSTWSTRDTLLTRAVDQGLVQDTTVIKQVSFVDLNGRDLTGVATADYSAEGNGGVLAWFDSDTSVLYIGGYGTIVAGDSLSYAFFSGQEENYIDSISGLDMLDTSNVTDMSSMFYQCGSQRHGVYAGSGRKL